MSASSLSCDGVLARWLTGNPVPVFWKECGKLLGRPYMTVIPKDGSRTIAWTIVQEQYVGEGDIKRVAK